eukprot:CAMPEP_0176495928 /NCGR_PEP_ID=MMETSP0200_2-20121128/10923_1 /TAXON_ID=947934 /ORGANISM="Chaetoceros sp., Strain GSL56" /LENGTH=414 /DNA_ID=CAMNT_0017893849 /DNA_START=310 /DNA_END=1554 /DNA_ORIENTATION=-
MRLSSVITILFTSYGSSMFQIGWAFSPTTTTTTTTTTMSSSHILLCRSRTNRIMRLVVSGSDKHLDQNLRVATINLGQSNHDNEQESSKDQEQVVATGDQKDDQVAAANPLNEEELQVISQIAQQEPTSLSSFLMSKLPRMPPNTILTLRNAAQGEFPSDVKDEQRNDMETVGKALVEIMDKQLEAGRDLLQTFLKCGEIRKLDGAIGKALRDGKLDMAFFTVLNLNIRDATVEAMENGESTNPSLEGQMGSGDNPNRLQILQHIYTRCQEEVEKTVSPGVGLLNKLLRTEQSSIRSNQLKYYLCPQEPKIIKSPDGKEVQLEGSKALVAPKEFIEALQNAVKQIRTVEKTGAADKVAAAGLVENCRQVAIEARLAIGEGYGVDSEELEEFELALQPVFRPESPDSEYIQGFQS